MLDSTLTFACHVHRPAGISAFFHLRQLRTARRSLTDNAQNTMVHLHHHYCNSVLCGMPAVHMRPLQNVLNSAARVVLKTSKIQHITATVRDQLHWLPVKQFAQALFVYKVLRQKAPLYSSCTCVSPCRRVSRNAIFARPLTLILWSCDPEQQDMKSEVFLRSLR